MAHPHVHHPRESVVLACAALVAVACNEPGSHGADAGMPIDAAAADSGLHGDSDGGVPAGADAGRRFHVVGPDIVDPGGRRFFPVGANVGIEGGFDWRGTAQGHVADALAWGWNTIRLTLYCTDLESWTTRSQYGYQGLLERTDDIVREYTAQDVVVMLECHDVTGEATTSGHLADQLDQFWTDVAIRYEDNPYVWLNAVNEPTWNDSAQWLSVQRHYLALVRATGAENVFVADVLNGGQDAAWDGAGRLYQAGIGPALESGSCNVVFSLHAYGGIGGDAEYSDYLDAVRAAGLAMVIGEFGYAVDGSSTAGTYEQNVSGAHAAFEVAPGHGVGVLWWHATHGDMYSLKTTGNAFYDDGAPGSGLSPAGRDLWNLGHARPDLGVFTGNLADSHCPSVSTR